MLSSLAKFVLGVFAGIFILAGGGVIIGYYLLGQLAVAPPKPTYAEERSKTQPVATGKAAFVASKSQNLVASAPRSPIPPVEERLEPGSYKGRISWSQGLSLRAEPTFESEKVGSAPYNQEVVVLKDSDDKKWQKVRLVDTDLEGWVKAGNIESDGTR